MRQTKITELTMSHDDNRREVFVRELLRQENKADLSQFLQNTKESSNMKLSVCKNSLRYFGVRPEDLIPELDEVQATEAFWKEAVLPADQVLIF